MKTSKNPTSADNQQERSKTYLRGYIAGLVDGEGSFHVAFAIREDLAIKVFPIPEFHISQNKESIQVLELAREIFGCGYIKANHQNSPDKTYVYVAKDKHDLVTKVLPFFEYNPLYTTKRNDYMLFAQITKMIINGHHRTIEGMIDIIELAYQMNGAGKRRQRSKEELIQILKSSETI